MRYSDAVTRALLPFALLGLIVACGGDAPETEADDAEVEMPFDVATAGHLQGMVLFEGDPPPPEVLDMSSEPDCASQWDDQPMRDLVQVSDGHLENVFIYVKEGLDGMDFPRARDTPVMDQVGCRYTPTVIGLMPGQEITFRNSDGLLHNINSSPTVNRGFNISQPVNMDTQRSFASPEVMIPVRCDVHGWMRAYIGVVPHPYHGVTGSGGSFDLRDLPPGEYVIEAWHSQLGTQEQTVTIATGETAEVSFTFTSEMLGTAVVPLGEPIYPHRHHAPHSAPATR